MRRRVRAQVRAPARAAARAVLAGSTARRLSAAEQNVLLKNIPNLNDFTAILKNTVKLTYLLLLV